jgi:hypothetical protein
VLELLEQERLKMKGKSKDVSHCKVHAGKKAKFFCELDGVFACSECLLNDHYRHPYLPARPLILGHEVSKA